jgi:hypothetical protein
MVSYDKWPGSQVSLYIEVGFEVLTAVTMKSIIPGNVMLYILVEVHRYFKGIFCLHLQC